MEKTNIITRWRHVLTDIDCFAKSASRNAADITLLAVSKTFPASDIEILAREGQRCFAENYVQEAVLKIQQLAHLGLEWHFIGPIQSNKTRLIAENFDWVHTISSYTVAKRLSDQRPLHKPPLNVCIQLNISNEISKHGVSVADLYLLAEQIRGLANLRLRGLMSIPAPTTEYDQQLANHQQLAQQFKILNTQGFALDTLSMGMSGDLKAAIEAGSTIVRVGSAIFGARQ